MSVELWVGFAIAMVLLMVVARWSLWVGFLVGATVLAIVGLDGSGTAKALNITVLDPGVILLAISVSIIPLIGGAMERSGLIDQLVQNLQFRKRTFLAFSPALVGTLPMPGGALLSAPLVKRGGRGVDRGLKCGINVWYRHILYLIYPLATDLIVIADLCGTNIYHLILYNLPFFFLSMFVGWLFLLKKVKGEMSYKEKRDWMKMMIPMSVLLAAPVLDLTIGETVDVPFERLQLAFGVTVSLLLAIHFGDLPVRELGAISLKMRPWNYGLIIIFMYMLLNIFRGTGIPGDISEMHLSPTILLAVMGAFLAFVTGRIILPASILIPIYTAQHGLPDLLAASILFFGTFQGYVLTPVHPCIAVTLEFFRTDYKEILRTLAGPTIVSMIVTVVVGLLLIG